MGGSAGCRIQGTEDRLMPFKSFASKKTARLRLVDAASRRLVLHVIISVYNKDGKFRGNF